VCGFTEMLPNAHYNYVLGIFVTMSIFAVSCERSFFLIDKVPISPISAVADPGFARGAPKWGSGEPPEGSKGRAPGGGTWKLLVNFHTKSG